MTTKATIEIEGEGEGDVTLTITFDPPPPEDKKVLGPVTAGIAIEMVRSFNLKSLLSYGEVPFKKIKMPQLNKEHTKEELELAFASEIEETFNAVKQSLTTDEKGDTRDAKTVPTKPTLH